MEFFVFFLECLLYHIVLFFLILSLIHSPKKTKDKFQEGVPLFEVGAKIEARYGGGDAYFPGMVSEINSDGSLFIAYDDGDEELSVPANFVRPCEDSNDEEDGANESGSDDEGAMESNVSEPHNF